jgi:hypothetical protein
MIRLSIDFEHSSRTWWDRGGQELWEGISAGFDESAVVLDVDLAQSWLAEAKKIPGWYGGPDHAPHPIAVQPIEDDEDFI